MRLTVSVRVIWLSMLWMAWPSQAFEVKPLVHDVAPFGREATSTLTITNPSDQPLPVEVTVNRRVFDEGAGESLVPADDDFLLFPPTALIPPGGTQAVRLQWLGDPELVESQSYYAHVAQLPVTPAADSGSEVQFVLAFNVAVHVAPEGAAAQIRVLDAGLETGADDEAVLRATLVNDGNGYTYASRMAMVILSPSASITLDPETILSNKLDTFLPPGVAKTMRIPIGHGNWTEPVTLSLQTSEAG